MTNTGTAGNSTTHNSNGGQQGRSYAYRVRLLQDWARRVALAAQHGGVFGGKPVSIHRIEIVTGPRAGALEIQVGDLSAGRMLKGMTANNLADSRQLIPWQFPGEPAAFMSGHAIRLEAAWPDGLAEKDIPLSSLGVNPHAINPKSPLRWIAGKNEYGSTVTMALSDSMAHGLVGGMTGAGKTVVMRSAVGQIARASALIDNGPQIILIDAKFGAGLGPLAHAPNLLGPMVTDPGGATDALAWALGTMKQRLISKSTMSARDWEAVRPILMVIDEIQEVTQLPVNVQILRQIAAQGREAKIHIIAGTQHPIIEAFGDSSIKRNLAGAVIALKVADAVASQVIVGAAEPDAKRLQGKGDSYIVAGGQVHRTQIAYLTAGELEQINGGVPKMAEWPPFNAEEAGQAIPQTGVGELYSAQEIALSIANAHEGSGRDRLKARFVEAGLPQPGSPKAGRLRDLGRGVIDHLDTLGLALIHRQKPLIIPDPAADGNGRPDRPPARTHPTRRIRA